MSTLQQKMELMGKALGLRAYRQQVLSSNVANADTPGYKARDFNFNKALESAMAGRPASGGLAMTTTSSHHLDGAQGNTLAALQYRTTVQGAVDGNTVDMDVERAQIAENSMHYEILTNLIADQFKGMRTALSSTNS